MTSGSFFFQELEDLEPKQARGTSSLLTTQFLRTVVLLLVGCASAIVACAGLSVLAYLLATHSLTPPQLQYTLPLPLDINGSTLITHAPIAQAISTAARYTSPSKASNKSPDRRLFPSGQRMDVWIDFTVPGSSVGGPSRKGELVHVTVELMSVDGRIAARATQPVLLHGRRLGMWTLATTPLRVLGLLGDDVILPIQLIHNFQELKEVPFDMFRLVIKARNSEGPEILAASARVNLRVGFLRRILYHLRPSTLLAMLLGAAAASAVLGGSATVGICLVILAFSAFDRRQGNSRASDGNLSDGSGLSDVLTPASSTATTPRGRRLH